MPDGQLVNPSDPTSGHVQLYEPAGVVRVGEVERLEGELRAVRNRLRELEDEPGKREAERERLIIVLAAELSVEVARLREALKAIRGPEDRGYWIEQVYRPAGGGYQGLQAIAEAALAADSQTKGVVESREEER